MVFLCNVNRLRLGLGGELILGNNCQLVKFARFFVGDGFIRPEVCTFVNSGTDNVH